MSNEPLFWLGFWVVVAAILAGLAYLESNDKGDKK